MAGLIAMLVLIGIMAGPAIVARMWFGWGDD